MPDKPNPRDPLLRADVKALARLADDIYQRHRETLERSSTGQFAAIDVISETVTVGRHAEAALESAKQKHPDGLFRLVRIGFTSAFRSSVLHARRIGAN